MDLMRNIMEENLETVARANFIPWDQLKNKTILVSGATGLIGTSFIKSLHHVNAEKNLELTVIALVRNEQKARERFSDVLSDKMLRFVTGTVEDLPAMEFDIHYIVHTASQTASKEFVQHPVETIQTSVFGTSNLLELARKKSVQGFVYLSSMEVYGYPERGHKVTEREIGTMSPLDLRNSYPIGKITAEAMCYAYAREYGIPAMICRLSQTIGPGVDDNDNRVLAYFRHCVKNRQNIVLKTRGETERSYLYTTDAVTAILTILLKGQAGSAYNAADEDTYCSIAEIAKRVADDGGIKVEYDLQDEALNGFLQTVYMNLDTSALKVLGWTPMRGKNQ